MPGAVGRLGLFFGSLFFLVSCVAFYMVFELYSDVCFYLSEWRPRAVSYWLILMNF